MGGWFSSEEPKPVYTSTRKVYSDYSQYSYYNNSGSTNTRPTYPSVVNESVNTYNYPTRPVASAPIPRYIPTRSTNLHKSVINNCYDWSPMSNEEVLCVDLNEYSDEFIKIKELFLDSTKRKYVNVSSIARVQNPYLKGRYLLKKQEMFQLYNHVEEEYMFHGTKSINVDNICTNNFDWRLRGAKIGHRFGQGVSFSPISYYASHYCDKTNTKIMLVAQVLTSEECIGDKDMIIPPYFNNRRKLRYDTSVKENGDVLVKFSDDEFYPAYKITFTVTFNYFQK